MTASAFEQDWYLFFQPFSTLYINQAYSEWNIIIHTGLHMIAQLSNLHDRWRHFTTDHGQNPFRFSFPIQFWSSQRGFHNKSPYFHKKLSPSRILVVVVKWRHFANGVLRCLQLKSKWTLIITNQYLSCILCLNLTADHILFRSFLIELKTTLLIS